MKVPGIAPGLFTHWATRWITGGLLGGAAFLMLLQVGKGGPLGGWLGLTAFLAAVWIYARFSYGREVITGQRELTGK